MKESFLKELSTDFTHQDRLTSHRENCCVIQRVQLWGRLQVYEALRLALLDSQLYDKQVDVSI